MRALTNRIGGELPKLNLPELLLLHLEENSFTGIAELQNSNIPNL